MKEKEIQEFADLRHELIKGTISIRACLKRAERQAKASLQEIESLINGLAESVRGYKKSLEGQNED